MMKKSYEKPFAEKVEFDYKSQMVVASGTGCTTKWTNSNTPCTDQSAFSVITPNP